MTVGEFTGMLNMVELKPNQSLSIVFYSFDEETGRINTSVGSTDTVPFDPRDVDTMAMVAAVGSLLASKGGGLHNNVVKFVDGLLEYSKDMCRYQQDMLMEEVDRIIKTKGYGFRENE